MDRAAIYSRVDPKDRGAISTHKAAGEALCKTHAWAFVHYTDSASGSRPPMQFAKENQLIRPGLTRLLSEVDAGRVMAIIPSADDAFSTNSDLTLRLEEYLQERGFSRQDNEGEPSYYFVRSEGGK